MTASAPRIVERDRRDLLGEGLLWSPRENAVFWTDILGKRLNRLSLDDARMSEWVMPDVIGWVIEREDRPGLVAGLGRSVVALTLDPFIIETIADLSEEPADNRVNDAKADAQGRIWMGTMPFGCDRPTGSLYRVDPGGGVARVATDYTIPNGPAIPAEGGYLLQTDTADRTIYRYAVNDDGSLGSRVAHVVFEDDWGHPDGMTFDADGGLWVACWGGSCVARFTPDGELDRRIALPASQITNVTFAGADLDRMFVTSAADGVDEQAGGCLFEVDPGCRGLPPHRFAG